MRDQLCCVQTALRQYIKARGGNWDEVAKLKSLPVCVNGDDILFKANEDFYTNFWQPAIKAIGFSLSQGKNYFAGAFLTVNSEGWRPMKNGRFQKLGYLNTGLIYAGPNGSMRPPLRQSHAEMPWTGKFQECLNGCVNPKRTLGRLLHFYGNDVWSHTKGGRLNLFAKVEQGGLGISLPPGTEPGWTWFQKALAHHLRHKVFNFFEECKVSLGAEMNSLLGLPEDFVFTKETEEPPCQSTYVTPRPAARSMARWYRDFGTWKTQWTIVPRTQPCGEFEHRMKDCPADEPNFLSYQLPWEETDSRRFYHRLSPTIIKAALKEKGRLADPSYFPWELRRVCSPHELSEQQDRIDRELQFVKGWEEGSFDAKKIYRVPVWTDYTSVH